MRHVPFLALVVGCLISAIITSGYAQTYNVFNDFSSTNNPNGVWSYEDEFGTLLGPVADYLGSGDPGWAVGAPSPVGWVGMTAPRFAFPAVGFIGHGERPIETRGQFVWTAPSAGRVTISGGIYKPNEPTQPNRCNTCNILYNGRLFNTIGGFPSDWSANGGPYDQVTGPKPFSLSVAGSQGLTFLVNMGDRIAFTNETFIECPDDAGSFLGFDLSITLDGQDSAPVGTLDDARNAFDYETNTNPVSGNWSLRSGDGNLLIPKDVLFGTTPGWTIDGTDTPPAVTENGGFAAPDGWLLIHPGHVSLGTASPARIRWTAPKEGNITLGGYVSVSNPDNVGRVEQVRIEHNGTTISTSQPMGDANILAPAPDWKTRYDPQELTEFDGGAPALSFHVAAGDIVDFACEPHPTLGDGNGDFIAAAFYVYQTEGSASNVDGWSLY